MYLLDTNILSELVKKCPNHNLLQHLQSNPSQSLFTSCICVMELRFGSALRKDFKSRNLIMVTANIRHFSKIKGLKVENWIVP